MLQTKTYSVAGIKPALPGGRSAVRPTHRATLSSQPTVSNSHRLCPAHTALPEGNPGECQLLSIAFTPTVFVTAEFRLCQDTLDLWSP